MKRPILGRQAELELVETLLGAAAGPAAIVFEGEPGIGKSFLLAEAVSRARGRGLTVLEALPSGRETELAYTGLADLLAGVTDRLDELPAPQRRALRVALLLEDPGPAAPDERAVAAAFLGVLTALSRESPVLVALDDVQWLDEASARALAFALRRVREERVQVLATLRSGGGRRGLDVVGGEHVERRVLGPLTVASVFALIVERLGTALSRPVVVRVHEVAGGNPLFALELARAVIERGATLAPGDPVPVPTELRELFLDRLGRLSPAAGGALAAAAALSRPTVRLVCASEGLAAADGLDEAVKSGAIEYDGERVRFAHPLIASVHYETLSPVRRRELHRRLAAVTDGEERAHHLARSVDDADAGIAAVLDDAARSARSRGASVAAAAFAEHALALTPAGDVEALHARHVEAANLAFVAGDSTRARELLETAVAAAPDGVRRATALGALARFELGAEDVAKAGMHFAAGLAEQGVVGELRASLLQGMAHASAIRDSLDVAVGYAREAVACAPRANVALRAQCLGMLARCEYHRGHGWTPGLLEEAVELERRGGTLAFEGSPTSLYAQALLEAGDVEAARALLADLCDRARAAGDSALSHPLAELSRLELADGNLDRAEQLARESHAVSVQAGRQLAQAPGLVRLGYVALARGHVDEAKAFGERALDLTQRTGRASRDPNALLGAIELARGRHAEARVFLERCNERHAELGSRLPTNAMVHGIEVYAALSRFDEAAALLEPVAEYAERLDRPRDHALAAYCAGILAAAEGELERAAGLFERSLSLCPLQPLVEAQRLLKLGAVQRRLRRKAVARRTLNAALAIFERAGAELWSVAARDELSRIGGRTAPREGLSATEQRIVDLVSAGRTTREVAEEMFVSAKTVEWNLTRIYRKLGVRGRTELAGRVKR